MTDKLLPPALSIEETLDSLLVRAKEVLPFARGSIYLYDENTRLLLPSHAYHPTPIEMGEGIIGSAAEALAPMLYNPPPEADDSVGSTAHIAAPIILADRLLGVFHVEATHGDTYTDYHLKLARLIADQAGLILNTSQLYSVLARRYERLTQNHAELVTRNEVSRLAASDTPLDKLLPKLLSLVVDLLDVDAAVISLDPEIVTRMRPVSAFGLDTSKLNDDMPIDLMTRIIDSGETLIVNLPQVQEVPPSSLIRQFGVKALLAMPLSARGRNIGAVFILNLRPNAPLSQTIADRAMPVLDQIALAIDNRNLMQHTQERLSETAALLEVAAVAAISLSADEMFETVLKLSREKLGATVGAFFLFNRTLNTLVLPSGGHYGIPEDFNNLSFPINAPGNPLSLVFYSGSPYLQNELNTAPNDSSSQYLELLRRLGLSNILIAPLRVQDEPMGIFLVGNKRGNFERADAQMLMAMGSHVAAALRSTELMGDMRQRLREKEALQRLAEIASATLDLDELLGRALQEAVDLLEVEGAVILLPHPEQPALAPHRKSAYGVGRELGIALLPFDSTHHMIYVYQTGKPYLNNALPHENANHNWRNMITCALTVRNRTLGIISLINRTTDFTDAHLDLLRAIAAQIATSMENAESFAVERQRADLMELVNHISQELTATLSLSELSRKVVTAIHTQLGYAVVNMFLLDDNGTQLRLSAVHSSLLDVTPPDGGIISINTGIAGRVARTSETQIVMDVSEDSDHTSAINQHGEMWWPHDGSALGVPLRFSTRTLGVIEAYLPRINAFRMADRIALETLASQVSIAVENARLWDQARRRLLEQGIVYQISRDLSAILDYSELVTAIVKHMGRALDTAQCVLVSVNNGRLVVEADYQQPDLEPHQLLTRTTQSLAPIQRTAVERTIQSMRQSVTTYAAEEAGGQGDALCTQLTLPIIAAGERVIGCVLWIETRSTREFTGSDVRLAQTLTSQAMIAMENARLFRQAQRQAHEQALLRQVAIELSNMPDIAAMAGSLARVIQALEGVNNVAVATRTESGSYELVAGEFTTCKPQDMLLTHLLWGDPSILNKLTFSVMLNDASDYAILGLAGQSYPDCGRKSLLLLPILRRNESVGVIEVSCDNMERLFEPREVQFLESLANQGAIAYDNISFHLREQRRLHRLEQLQLSSRNIAGQLDMNAALDIIVRESAWVFSLPAVSLMMMDGETYRIRASLGLSDRYVRERRAKVNDYDAHGVQIIRSDALPAAHTPEERELIASEGWSSTMVVPLRKGEQHLGVLNFYLMDEHRTFSDEEKELALLFAAQAAVALENAHLFEVLEDRAVELAQANQLRSEFLARVSHELRTPMNSIINFSEMLLQKIYGDITDRQADRIERILRNGRNLLALIDDLLDISKIDAGRMELSIESLNIRDEVMNILTTTENQATRRGLYLRYDVDGGLPLIRADQKRLRQILVNLLGNAIKFTKQGGITLRSTAYTDHGMNYVLTSVADTGIGIRKEDQAIIFDEFRQADGSITREYGGTGLGLAITKKLVEMMGGRIWIESEVGVGSTFYFTMPVVA